MKHNHTHRLKKIVIPLAALLSAYIVFWRIRQVSADYAPIHNPRMVTDMSGKSVAVPQSIQRVATLEVLGYEKMFLLGQSDKIVLMNKTNAPWMTQTNPHVKQIPKFYEEPDAEALMNMKIDLALYAYDPVKTREKLRSIGIAGVVSQPSGYYISSAQMFEDLMKRNMRVYAELLGGDAKNRAEEWCQYFDDRVRYVSSRVASIPQNERPHIYYLRGPAAIVTQGRNSHTLWFGEMAGGDLMALHRDMPDHGAVSIEDILAWNPEYIFVGRMFSPALVLKDPRWRDVRAVKEGKVYQDPEGVFYWDGSSEGVLLMEFMAQKMYPDRFADLDMAKEVKDYYARFYRYQLTNDEAEKILQGKTP